MAFQSDASWGNLPNGNFSPVIFSRKAQKAFRKSSVVEDITNTDYTGEISSYGDSVRIIKEPTIEVKSYARGTNLETQDLQDVDFSMVVDQANYFQFAQDDIEEAHSHVNFMDLATDEAGYQLRDTFDQEVLGYLAGWEKDGNGDWVRRTSPNGTKAHVDAGADELLAKHKLDITNFGGADLGVEGEVTSIPLAPGGGSGAVTSPLALLNRFGRKLDQANVPTEGRWVVVDPIFIEMLMDEDSKLVDADFGGDGEIRNGMLPRTIRGFRVYKTNNLPYVGDLDTSASEGSETDFGVIVAGHDSAVATAQQIAKTEKFRSDKFFGDVCRGMQLYGRKILRAESLLTANYNPA